MKNRLFPAIAFSMFTLFLSSCAEIEGAIAAKKVCNCFNEAIELADKDQDFAAGIKAIECYQMADEYTREFEQKAAQGDRESLEAFNSIMAGYAIHLLKLEDRDVTQN